MSLPRHVLAVAAALSIVLAACGSSTATQAPTAEPTAAPTVASTPAPTPEPTASPTESPTETPGESTTAGRTGTINVADKFEITLADGWVEVALTEEDFQNIIDAFPEGSQMGETLKAQLPTLLAAGVVLWAVDLQSGGPGTNLNTITQPASSGMSMQLLRVVAEQGISQVPGLEGKPTVSDVTVDGNDGVQVAYRLTQALADGSSVTVDGTQVYVATDSDIFIFTFTIMTGGDDSDVQPMIDSIKFL